MEFIFIPLIVLAAPVLIILITLRYRDRQTQARYRTLLQLADPPVGVPSAKMDGPSNTFQP